MVSRNRPSRTPRKCLAIPEVKFGDLTWNRDWAFCFHASTAWTVAFSMFLARQSLTSGTGQQFHAFFLFNNPLLGTGGENLYAMCYIIKKLKTCKASNSDKLVYYAELIGKDGNSISVEFSESSGSANSIVYASNNNVVYPIEGVISNPKPLSQYQNGDIIVLGPSIKTSEIR